MNTYYYWTTKLKQNATKFAVEADAVAELTNRINSINSMLGVYLAKPNNHPNYTMRVNHFKATLEDLKTAKIETIETPDRIVYTSVGEYHLNVGQVQFMEDIYTGLGLTLDSMVERFAVACVVNFTTLEDVLTKFNPESKK